jgi:archaellum component FlaF (FlaF/FlaG flagellin family)
MAATKFKVVVVKKDEGASTRSDVLIDGEVVRFNGADTAYLYFLPGQTYTLILYNTGTPPGSTTVTVNRVVGGEKVMDPLPATVLNDGAGYGRRKFKVS